MIEAFESGVPIIASAIPAFRFLAGYTGVCTISADDSETFSAAARAFLDAAARFDPS